MTDMEAEVEGQEQRAPTAPTSKESRCRVADRVDKRPSSSSKRGRVGRGRGTTSRGSAASNRSSPTTTPSASQATDVQMDSLSEEEEEENSVDIDRDDDLSVSLPSVDEEDESQGDDGAQVDQQQKKGGKRSKAGVQLSPSKCKLPRAKRAGCWKYFKVINVPSKKEFGVMITKAKCKFCGRGYVYNAGGPTSQLNRHLKKCTPYLNKSELLIYLDEANVSVHEKNFNLLNYWKVNAHRFPVVSSMAKRFLVVPASSVSSESTFSTAGRVLDDYRSSLKPTTVQALICASSWIRGSPHSSPILLGEDDQDIESVEFPKCVVASN